VLEGVADRVRGDTADYSRVAAELRAQGVRPPCVVTGTEAIRVAFRTGCASRQVGGHDASITAAELAAVGVRQPVAVLVSGDQDAPAYARGWRPQPLPGLGRVTDYRAYLSPAASP
jgi:hypothetical protein